MNNHLQNTETHAYYGELHPKIDSKQTMHTRF